MDDTSVWFSLAELPATSQSAQRCTWHGDRDHPCQRDPVTGVYDSAGSRWSACPDAARAIAARLGVPLPPGISA